MSRAEGGSVPFLFDPADGRAWMVGVTTAADYEATHPHAIWRYDPWTGIGREAAEVAADPYGRLFVGKMRRRRLLPTGEWLAEPGAVNYGNDRRRAPAPAREPYKRGMTLDEIAVAELYASAPGPIEFAGPEPVETDPTGRSAHAPGAKMDAGKPRVWLCVSGFSNALQAVADVTTRGAEKYAPNSWMSVPDGVDRYMEGFARHALALGRGETHDTGPGGTGCLHKAQMIWNLLASLELEIRNDAG